MSLEYGFTPLFNGRDLEGWVGDASLWKAENGILVGRTTSPLNYNDFLRTEKEYGNFILSCNVRLVGHNSGIQFRSEVRQDGHMAGYQADIGDGCWGALYEECLRGHLVNYQPQLVEAILLPNDWNHYQIIAVRDVTLLILNGVVTSEFHDSEGTKTGYIGLQIHSGPPQEVAFRELCIKALSP